MSRQRFKNRSEPKIPMLVLKMNEPEETLQTQVS